MSVRRRGPSGGHGPLRDRAGQGVAVLLEPGNQAPRTREKEQCGQYQQRSRDVLVTPMEGSPHPSPRDYERWLWRDETTDARRRRMARTIVSPAAVNATPPTYTRAGLVEREAPPNPVCGAPVGMTDATVPVAPPAPLAVPVEPPAPTAPPLPPASPPVAVVPPAAVVPPVPLRPASGWSKPARTRRRPWPCTSRHCHHRSRCRCTG